MKLLFLTEFYPRDEQLIFTGGVEARVYYLTQAAKKDFTIKVITSTSPHIPATPLSIISRLGFMAKSFWQALRSDFDLVEASNVVSYLSAFLAAKLKSKPALAQVHDVLGLSWFEFGWLVGIFGYWGESICLRLPWTKIIAVSRATKDKLIKAGVNPGKISVIYNGINPDEFKFARPAKFKSFTIICLARLVKTKRVDQLIAAAAKLRLKLIVVGFGPQEARLKRLAQGKVKFLKQLPRQELLPLISRCHLFCLPSIVEGFGIATIEAMACGLPAVLTDIPANREVTRNGQGAVFFEPENVDDLAAKIKSIKSIYKQKQQEALVLTKNYSWQKIYQQTKRVYEACLHH